MTTATNSGYSRATHFFKPFTVGIATLTMLALVGCSDLGTEPAPSKSPDDNQVPVAEISFQGRVRPILQSSGCTSCHGGSGGLTVTTVADLLRGGDHGSAVVAGKPESSNLVLKLQATPPFGSRMPQGGPFLPDSTIQVIRDWIAQGAKNN